MELCEILHHVDHTLLAPTATWEEIKETIDDGIRFGCASVCIPPCYVARASKYAEGRIKICTVIGFPNGYNTTVIKCAETAEAVRNGADEIDLVINIGMIKAKDTVSLLDEIGAVRKVCGGLVMKVIVETCLLTEEEKRLMCRVVSASDAEYIKTSTGFSKGGATFEDIALFKECVTPTKKIKAAGGISSVEDAEKFLALGADRLGTSRLVKIAKEIK